MSETERAMDRPSKGLFPVLSTSNQANTASSSSQDEPKATDLSAASGTFEESNYEDSKQQEMDWLENKSFIPASLLLASQEPKESRQSAFFESTAAGGTSRVDKGRAQQTSSHSKGRPSRASGLPKEKAPQTGYPPIAQLPGKPSSEKQPEFKLDLKSEKSLYNYESICKDHVAKYSRVSHHCLGSRDIYLQPREGKPTRAVFRYYDKGRRKQLKAKGRFVTAHKSTKRTASARSCVGKEQGKSVEAIFLSGCDRVPLEVDASEAGRCPAEEDDPGEEEAGGRGSERGAYYHRLVTADPANVRLWLEFVAWEGAKGGVSKGDERRRAILDRALAANPRSLELRVCRLEEDQGVRDSASLQAEWEELVEEHPSNPWLWRQFLLFHQTYLPSFTVGGMVLLYHRAFAALRAAQEAGASLEEELIGVFEQYSCFLHQSGFTEKAVASYQALIEFNLFRPSALNLTSTQDSLAMFESFWDSGTARFGEGGAKGWAAWFEGSRTTEAALTQVSTEGEQEEILKEKFPEWQTWLKIERLRENAHWLPWRPDVSKEETEDDCEDLDRLVLCEDVSPALFRLTDSASCLRILHGLLNLLGCPRNDTEDSEAKGCKDSNGRDASKDPAEHLTQLRLQALHQVAVSPDLAACCVPAESEWRPGKEALGLSQRVLRQAAAYFSGWNRTLFNCRLLHMEALTLTHSTGSAGSSGSAGSPGWLPAASQKAVRRLGKGLLRDNRGDLLLWDAYVRLEWAYGRCKEAAAMAETALAMSSPAPSSDSAPDHIHMAGLCALHRTLAEIGLNLVPAEWVGVCERRAAASAKSRQKVVRSLWALVEGVPPNPAATGGEVSAAQVLKTRRGFEASVSALLTDLDGGVTAPAARRHLALRLHCFVLFELSAAGVKDAVRVMEAMLERLALSGQQAEDPRVRNILRAVERELTANLLASLKNIMAVETISLSHFQSRLYTGLARFPEDPDLLCTLVDMESKTFMAGKSRRFFEKMSQDPASVYPGLFAVLAEMCRHARIRAASQPLTDASACSGQSAARGASGGGAVHRVRAACERGLQGRAAKHCPLLWRIYLRFEAEFGSLVSARGIFYRALQSCPWAKALYVDGVELFGADMLQEVLDLMTEKELRVQAPMEEVTLLLNSEARSPETAT